VKQHIMDSVEEIFVPVRGFPNYVVSNHGRVKNVKFDRFLDGKYRLNGYKEVGLRNNDGRSFLSIHRLVAIHFIPNPENKPCVDHIEGKITDNHVSNLRWATHAENMRNRMSRTDSSSRHLGVYWCKSKNKWRAVIRFNGKNKHIGLFEDEDEAGRAYDAVAREHHGEFARCNFPLE